ncbi:hypothetical protein [Laspinema olomoucense]|uniref:Uncharacterized protein n=2 Tax=Laspinema TaxID=2584823 RepID=A0ABT2N887_9CYAN|nr:MULTISPECIES: hypothetical protein [unclassified Laspinema]MCT7973268.1 hypothetical protein [Laspinema sp. D3d]MCT7978812.1 hypothetical protein [Laspinema sp. D3b]MCT7989492.1 hypothetical protein [Laspinema sp. D3a]
MNAGVPMHFIAPQSGMKMQKVLSFFLSLKFIGLLICLVIFCSIFPFFLAFAGMGLANLLGCGGSGPGITCPNPMMGEILTSMVLMHWLGLITLPTGFLVAGVLSIIFVLRWVMLERRH